LLSFSPPAYLKALAEPLQAPVSGFSVQVSGRRNIVLFFLAPET
jgi:hypothetical protein